MSRSRLVFLWDRTCCLCTGQVARCQLFEIGDDVWKLIASQTGIQVIPSMPLQVCCTCIDLMEQPTAEFRVKCMEVKEMLKLCVAVIGDKPQKAWPREFPDSILEGIVHQLRIPAGPDSSNTTTVNWRHSVLLSSPQQWAPARQESEIEQTCAFMDGKYAMPKGQLN